DSSSVQLGGYDALDRPATYTFQPAAVTPLTTSMTYNDGIRKLTEIAPNGENHESLYTPFGLLLGNQHTNPVNSQVLSKNATIDGKTVRVSIPYANDDFSTTTIFDTMGRPRIVSCPLYTTSYQYANVAENQSSGENY